MQVNVGRSVQKAIDDWEVGDHDSAMLHACNAIDGTANKLHPKMGSNARFTKFLRDSYSVLGPMGMPGIDLLRTRFPVTVERPKAPGGKPDLADVIYGIHRCTHGHGDELPDGFALISDAAGPAGLTRVSVERGAIRLSDRIIFGLIAAAVFCPANLGQTVPSGYFLTFGITEKLVINDWWGRGSDFVVLAAQISMPLVVLDFGDWIE